MLRLPAESRQSGVEVRRVLNCVGVPSLNTELVVGTVLRHHKMAGNRHGERGRERHKRRTGEPSAQALARVGVCLHAHRVPIRVT